MGEEDLDREESEGEEATVLPEREAMSIISQGSPSGEEDATPEERRESRDQTRGS
jgi:hypothetical protein